MYWYLHIPDAAKSASSVSDVPKPPKGVFKPPALLQPGSLSIEKFPNPKAAFTAPSGWTKVGGLPIVDQPPLSLAEYGLIA